MTERTTSSGGPDLLGTVEDALTRVCVVVCELENGETGTAYQVATDLELDLQFQLAVALDDARDEKLKPRPV